MARSLTNQVSAAPTERGNRLFHVRDADHRLMQHRDLGRLAHVGAGHRDRLGQVVGAFPAEHLRHVRVLGAGDDHLADVLASVLAPVPHEERMRAVVSVAAPVHLDVARVVRELALVLFAQIKSVARLGQQTVEELDVARMKVVIELVVSTGGE